MINNATIIREKRKTLKIIIDEKKGLIVVAPITTSLDKISEILEKKKVWIEKNLRKQEEAKITNFDFTTYRKTLLSGKVYKLELTEKIKKISIGEDVIFVPCNIQENIDKFVKKIKKWYKTLAEIVLKERISVLSNSVKIPFSTIKIGDFKGKWGSCDSSKNIKLNWRLVMLKPDLIDFVILHELSHTKEMNHSVKFYQVLSSMVPAWKRYRKELKEYSFLLNLYRN